MLNSHRESKLSVISRSLCSSLYCSSLDFSSTSNSFSSFHYSDVSEYLSWSPEGDPVQSVLENEAYCFDVCRFSEKLLDAIFLEATTKLSNPKTEFTVFDVVCPVIDIILNQVVDYESYNLKPESTQLPSSTSPKLDDLSVIWPTIFEFNIKFGQEQIEQYLNTWKRSSDWMFCIEFLGFESEDCSNVFIYEVEWSKPTKSYPIPQATASVYFALEVHKIVPDDRDRSVDVTYIFECSSVIHKPGKTDFQEKWLQDILDEKIKCFKKMTFSVPAGICGPSRPTVGEDYWPSNYFNLCNLKKHNL